MSESVISQDGFLLAALAIASGRPGTEAAKIAGVSVRTIRRWSNRKSFADLVTRLRDETISAALGQLLSANASAVETMTALLKSQDERVRLAAASKVLSLTLAVRDQTEVRRHQEDILDMLRDIRKREKEQAGGYSRSTN